MQSNQRKRATLQQVADRAGVSIATASRALSGSVASAASAGRVREAVSELGYIPNEAARSLRSERTMTIGVAFFSLKLPGALDMLEAISAVFDRHGYTLLIADTGANRSRFDVILGRFLERRVDALLCVNPDAIGPTLDWYREAGVPALALISRGRGAGRLPLIAPSLEPAATEAVRRFEEHGHRRICAMLPGGEGGPFRAVWSRLRASSLEVVPMNPFARNFSPIAAVDELCAEGITAVLSTYPVALRLLAAARERGIAVPGDLSIAAVSDEPRLSELLETPLSAINVDMGAFGSAAAETLIRWLRGEAPQRNTLVAAATWIERVTTGRASTLGPG